MSLESLQSVIVLLIGFSVAGSLATGYQLVTERPLSFRLLNSGPQPVTFLAIPVLTFAAPFVIMRNVMRGRRIERRRFERDADDDDRGTLEMLSGTVVVSAFTAFHSFSADPERANVLLKQERRHGDLRTRRTRPRFPTDKRYWIAETAVVIGRVRLKQDASISWGSVLRGDNEWMSSASAPTSRKAARCIPTWVFR